MKAREIEYVQDMHSCGPSEYEEATAKLTLCDGGAGEYLVLNAHQWALSDEKEIDTFADMLKQFIATAKE